MKTDLQQLRDQAEQKSLAALDNNDKDSADAWETIALAIDECLKKTKADFSIIEARTGLFEHEAERKPARQ